MGEKRHFEGDEDLNELKEDLEWWFEKQGYELQTANKHGKYVLQAKKESKLRTFTGTNMALTVYIEDKENGGLEVEVGSGKWQENITGSGLSGLVTGGLTWVTGAAGAAWIKKVESDVWEWFEDRQTFGSGNKIETSDDKKSGPPAPPPKEDDSAQSKAEKKKEEKLSQLREAKESGILTEDEFQEKKEELEKEVEEFEIEARIEEKKEKFSEALENGILTEEEYNEKINNLESDVRKEVKKEKLDEALENGILSEEEYEEKIAQLE